LVNQLTLTGLSKGLDNPHFDLARERSPLFVRDLFSSGLDSFLNADCRGCFHIYRRITEYHCVQAFFLICYHGVILCIMKKAKPQPQKRGRSPGQAQTSFSIDERLLNAARDLAKADKRPFSNWLSVVIEEKVKAAGKL
jgi:hypothetical protein